MCRYCDLIETGVGQEKTNDNVIIGTVRDGSQIFDLTLFRYIDEENNERYNELILEISVDVRGHVYPLKQENIKINYCPFCGKEL